MKTFRPVHLLAAFFWLHFSAIFWLIMFGVFDAAKAPFLIIFFMFALAASVLSLNGN